MWAAKKAVPICGFLVLCIKSLTDCKLFSTFAFQTLAKFWKAILTPIKLYMGLSHSAYRENPIEGTTATLYYFSGRGLADQIRWMLAATNIDFAQKIIDKRARFVDLCDRQLPFAQLPLLQIDGYDLVQSQAIIRYLAKRGNIAGATLFEQTKCDMIAESVKDMLPLLTGAPFKRHNGVNPEKISQEIREKWAGLAPRYEAILEGNGKKFLVGDSLTYTDVLMAHAITWVVEETEVQSVELFPNLVALQNTVINLPGVRAFIRSQLYYPVGNSEYCDVVSAVLARKI